MSVNIDQQRQSLPVSLAPVSRRDKAKTTLSTPQHDAEVALALLSKQHGVVGLVLLDGEGRIVRESGDHDACVRAGQAGIALASLGRAMVLDVDATDDLELLRCRSSGMELALVQGSDFTLISVVLV